MSALIDLQIACQDYALPSEAQIQLYLDKLLANLELANKELTVRIVEEDEIQQLNQQYRGKDSPTNVLSFPFEAPSFFPEQSNLDENLNDFLGDIVICAPVVEKEAQAQHKQLNHHWAHMLIHGTLHLLGYDHIEEQDAQVMENIEIAVLKELAIDDPYQNH
ncbi:rRNA maturation RNase YbeY [Paraglaciecola aestuariivivens]